MNWGPKHMQSYFHTDDLKLLNLILNMPLISNIFSTRIHKTKKVLLFEIDEGTISKLSTVQFFI